MNNTTCSSYSIDRYVYPTSTSTTDTLRPVKIHGICDFTSTTTTYFFFANLALRCAARLSLLATRLTRSHTAFYSRLETAFKHGFSTSLDSTTSCLPLSPALLLRLQLRTRMAKMPDEIMVVQTNGTIPKSKICFFATADRQNIPNALLIADC
jgi:hypothetical protein